MATAGVAAQHLFISVSRFRDLVDSGIITRAASGAYDLDKVREQYISNLRKNAIGRSGANGDPADAGGGTALSTQRSRLIAARAAMVERRLDILSGEYVRLEVIGKALDRMVFAVREIALGTPGKISDAVSQITGGDRWLVYRIIDDEIREMLDRMSVPEALAEGKADMEKNPPKGMEVGT